MWGEGLPYIPRVHLSEGSLVRNPLRWLCSEEPVVRRSFIPKSILSESCYVPKIPYSERTSTIWILCYEGSLVRISSSPNGALFRRFHMPKITSPLYQFYITKGSLVRSSSSSKVAMLRRFYFPNIAHSIRTLLPFFSPEFRKLNIVCSYHSPNDYLSISVIRRQCQCVCPPQK